MKLINKISVYFLASSLMIFVVISLGIYLLLGKAVEKEIDEQLSKIYDEVVREIKNGKQTSFYPFVQVDSINTSEDAMGFSDVQIFNKEENETEPFRQLTSFASINGKNYKIIVRTSLIEKEDILTSILTITLLAFSLFVIILFFMNKTLSQKIFKDFYDSLKRIETFSVKENSPIVLKKSDIEEFKKLNESISFLSEKAINEYRSLKEFSEETNHELQTPVSVIKSKLELLIQNSLLSENDYHLLETILKNLNKLEKISKSLLLLNKLEHKELFEENCLNLSDEINSALKDNTDFIESKELMLDVTLDKNTNLIADQSLINILLSNLISNAIKHNHHKGKLIIQLSNNKLTVSNTTEIKDKIPAKFFDRFYKSNNSDSVGLGLTIAKKICDLYGFVITNQFSDNFYSVMVEFNKTKFSLQER
ncbi:sensor histidine kinase [Melioribacteraceae bacterium 4301-Me]|uniref:sensor histidine kinase n=1 Tax=Pyranulibacter aquaticus TaxID=3163344 RepID=UPI003597A435